MKVVLLLALAGYLGVAGLVWTAQERLIFFPRPALGTPRPPEGWKLETVELVRDDGVRLAGVLLLPPVERPPLVLYFGGNAEEVTEAAEFAARDYGRRAVLLVNYRGYGRSQGKPAEAAMMGDALALHDWAAARTDLDTARIALHGRSLGSAIAVRVAAERPVRCVVLTSPLASVLDVARELYPWLPVSLLLRHPFDVSAYAPRATAPLLVLVGERDRLVKPHHSERLAGLWGGPVERVTIGSAGHNDVHLDPTYGAAIHRFLDGCL